MVEKVELGIACPLVPQQVPVVLEVVVLVTAAPLCRHPEPEPQVKEIMVVREMVLLTTPPVVVVVQVELVKPALLAPRDRVMAVSELQLA